MTDRLPMFTDDGLLPVGDYPLTLAELDESFLVTGRGVGSPGWDRPWRRRLVRNFSVMVRQLWQAGIDQIFVDGSFVEDKDHPNDIDGYFECDVMDFVSGRLERALNALDPHKIWTWNPATRRPDPDGTKRQLPMWHQYRVELYPHYAGALSGLRGPLGNALEFPEAFRQRRNTSKPKGIVQIVQAAT